MRTRTLFIYWTAAALALAVSTVARASDSSMDSYSTLKVQLGLRNGFIATVRDGTNASHLEPSADFLARSKEDPNAVEKQMLDGLDVIFRKMGPAFVLCLSDQFRTNYPTNFPPNV